MATVPEISLESLWNLKAWKRGLLGYTSAVDWNKTLLTSLKAREWPVNKTGKEETTARIRSVAKHQESIRVKLDLCIDPLNPSSHPTNIVNIVSGKAADDAVNAQDAVSIGTEAMKEHERQ